MNILKLLWYLRLRTILLMIVVSRCFISRCDHLFSLVVSLLSIDFIALFSHALEVFYFKVSTMFWCDVIQFITSCGLMPFKFRRRK